MPSASHSLITLAVLAFFAVKPEPLPAGTYALTDISGHQLPLYLGGGFNGEGANVDSATLVLRRNSRFTARVVISWTDSGTFTYPRVADGTWRVHKDSIVLTYQTVRMERGCWGRTCADSARKGIGLLTPAGLVFVQFAGLGPAALGEGNKLNFRRISN